jgi:hypothetical protein
MPRNITTFTSLLVSDRKNPGADDSVGVVAEIQSDARALLVLRLTGDALKALEVTLLQQGVN